LGENLELDELVRPFWIFSGEMKLISRNSVIFEEWLGGNTISFLQIIKNAKINSLVAIFRVPSNIL
jgi:hypothetical protein